MEKKRFLFCLAIAFSLIIAACHNDDDDPESTTTTTSLTVTTLDMVEVGTDYAVFPSVTVSGTASSCYFYMSESSDMASITQVSENATVTGLSSGTTYYYEACATDGTTEYYGSVKSFTTDYDTFYVSSVDSIGVDGSSNKFSAVNGYANTLGALVEFTPSGEDSYLLSDIGNDGGIYITRSGAGSDETWTLSEDIPISTGTYQFYAYYPYSDDISADNTLLSFDILEQGSLSWGTSGSISSSTSAVSIEMQEMLVTINISVTCEGRSVENMYIYNADHAFPGFGYMDVITGELTYPEEAYDYDIVAHQTAGSTSFSDSQECTFRTFPASFDSDDLMIVLVFSDGTQFTQYISADSWSSGEVFDYEVYVELEEEEEGEDSEDTGSDEETSVNGHAAVDLGLSVKWATCNVGADSPEDYGNYYAWGETEAKSSYTKSNSDTYGVDLDDISGNAEYDVATANWGDSWRLPTYAEIEELLNGCTWEWTVQNDVSGYLVTGSNGNSIFLPASGYRRASWLYSEGSSGYYWSSTSSGSGSGTAYYLYFFSGHLEESYAYRYRGHTVRPVTE